MATSLDGRIVVDGWPSAADVRKEYEQVHASYDADGWMCGRVTMEPFAGGVRSDIEVAREYRGAESREDFIAEGTRDSFAFAVDPSGRLAWQSNDIDGDHVVAILSERVSDDYLATLRDRGVSYLLAGRKDFDASLALEKIGERFGVRTLMLEGGGKINGALLQAGLIDEVSVIVTPVADGRTGNAALFDVAADSAPVPLVLENVERRAADLIWLRYRIESRTR
jgi:2,5-diamino-6-(ribosylamino)-4(3H)-pyrimidinone 5'-phosphate reductase